jgi:hypothetical protein
MEMEMETHDHGGPRESPSAREGSPSGGAGRGGRSRWRWVSLGLLLALALAAVLAPSGQAQSAAGRTPEAEAAAAQKATEKAERTTVREEQVAANEARRETVRGEREAERRQRAAERAASREQGALQAEERKNAVVAITCTSVSWTFREFVNAPGNTVTEKITVDHVGTTTSFSFDGSTGTNVTPIHAPPGSYIIDAEGKWSKASAKGLHGGFDIHVKITCLPTPSMSVEKLQQIEGDVGSYTDARITGEVGETVDYEIAVSNTGNVPLTFGPLVDPKCDAGTISGGPPAGVLAVGATSTYLCEHVLDAADLEAGTYSNQVTLTGTPPEVGAAPLKEPTNTVVTEVELHVTPPPQKTGTTTTGTSTTSTPVADPAPAATGQPAPRSGVLGFSSASVPSLRGPQGCVRSSFHASVASAGVASVTFYLDGHRLRRLTAHSARGGRLTVTVNPAKLRVGAHRLLAKITMVKASGKAVLASRSITILRCHSKRGHTRLDIT